LSQVKKIIDQHRGSIDVQSRKGEGTRVIVTLPAK
jgi:signal transduction histidine kinase